MMKICYVRRPKSGNGRLRDFARHMGGFYYLLVLISMFCPHPLNAFSSVGDLADAN